MNELPSDLPLVLGDKTKLSQVFYNLIGNAARFTHVSLNTTASHANPFVQTFPRAYITSCPYNYMVSFCEQSGYIKVAASLSRGDSTIDIVVTDTGVGVPKEKMEAIFQPYEQVGNTSVTHTHYCSTFLYSSHPLPSLQSLFPEHLNCSSPPTGPWRRWSHCLRRRILWDGSWFVPREASTHLHGILCDGERHVVLQMANNGL